MRLLILLSAAALFLTATHRLLAAGTDKILARRNQLESEFHDRCLEIIGQTNFVGNADLYRNRLAEIRRPGQGNLLFLSKGSFVDQDGTSSELQQLTQQQATSLVQLAGLALEAGFPSLAYQVLHQAAFFDPKQPTAQAILGLKAKGDTRLVAKLAKTAHRDLPWKRRGYWRVTTDHYQIVTNVNEQAGMDLADQMEVLHTAWRQLFFDCWSDRAHLQGAWRRTRPLPLKSHRHRVVLFASRDEYVQHLRSRQPRIDITLGFYDVRSKTTYFFAGPDSSPSTQFHEATHQLFQELPRTTSRLATERNFWIVEGMALYIESLRRNGPCVTLGGYYADRLQFARYRRLQEDFYVPLEELVSMGRDALQQDPRIRRLYSQAAGLTHFLMDDQGGLHRVGLMDYLRRIYRGEDQPDELARTTKTTFASLDQQYRDFLNVTNRDLRESLLPKDSIESLCLGRTLVTDEGLILLTSQKKLKWLDLAHLPVTDRGLEFVRGAGELRQVNLEGSDVSDLTLAMFKDCRELEELDLSHTKVTDLGIKHIASLPGLRVLWLTGTRITDRSLDLLADSTSIEQLDVSETRVTRQGRRRLQERLPKLRLD